MSKIDWIIHLVFDPHSTGGLANNHTHGMERYGHMDFQLVLPYKPEEVGYLLNSVGKRVQDGERFSVGDMVQGLYTDCDVRLDQFTESGRQVLRLIVPDANNRFPEDPHCQEPYKYQTQRVYESLERGFVQ